MKMFLMSSLFGVFVVGTFFGGLLQRPNPFIDRKVAGPQVLGPEWIEIKVDEPLKPVGDYQEIGLVLAKPFEVDLLKPRGVRVADGSMVMPDVELVTSDGTVAPMEWSGGRGKTTMTFRLKDESIKRDYERIRIRATHEVRLDSVFWTGIVIKNMP